MDGWYAAFCKPRREAVAELNLNKQGYAVYLPQLLVRRRRAGKWGHYIEPLFPRYLFVKPRDDAQSLAPVRSTIGVVDFVRLGGRPAVVSDALIEELRERQDAAAADTRHDPVMFQPGMPVKFVDGPLSGLEAIFSKATGSERVIVLLELLGKMNALRVDLDWLAPAA